MFSGVQENNSIRLPEIQSHIIQDNTIFNNIQQVSLCTLACILKWNQIRMKQLYKQRTQTSICGCKYNTDCSTLHATLFPSVLHTVTPFWLISVLCFQRVVEMDDHAIQHEFIFIDEAGFNLANTRRRGRNIIGPQSHYVPGQCDVKIRMCAAISNMHGVLHHHASLGLYNTTHILTFLDRLHNILIPPEHMNDADHQRNRYVVAWDNVRFHRAAPVQNWFFWPPTISRAIPPTILTFSEPHRRVLFGMEVEGIGPAALCAHDSCAGYWRAMPNYFSCHIFSAHVFW